MGPGEIAFLALAGFGAGLIGSTAGLASLVSYPALLVVGLPPVTANVTNSVGLVGSSIGSVSGSRPELRGLGRLGLLALPLAVAAGVVGSVLLLQFGAPVATTLAGFAVVATALLMLTAPALRVHERLQLQAGVGAGFFGGVLGGLAAMPGPLVFIYLLARGSRGRCFRASSPPK